MPAFAVAPISINEIEDEDSFVNLGFEEKRKYMMIDMKPNEVSSWLHYPEQYKFFSLDFDLNRKVHITNRTTYDLIDMLSEIGGL